MTFLTPKDFDAQIREDQLMTILGDDPTLLDEIELAVISEAESYLRQRYLVSQVFAATDANRFPILVLYLVDMVLYHLHSRINPRKVPDLREKRYDMAIHWLQEVAKGRISPDLPESCKTADDIRWGSNRKLGNEWFGNGY